MKFQTFSPDTKRLICDCQNGYCYDCLDPIHSIHHELPNNKHNRLKFPLFIHSPMNGKGLCFEHHKNDGRHKITEREAKIYEEYLEKLQGGRLSKGKAFSSPKTISLSQNENEELKKLLKTGIKTIDIFRAGMEKIKEKNEENASNDMEFFLKSAALVIFLLIILALVCIFSKGCEPKERSYKTWRAQGYEKFNNVISIDCDNINFKRSVERTDM